MDTTEKGGRSLMSMVRSDAWIDPLAPFEIVFEAFGTGNPVVLRSAPNADRATVVFHDEWECLRRDQVVGELLLISHDENARTLLREPLGPVQRSGTGDLEPQETAVAG